MTIPKTLVNPFSETFLEKWELWKAFRWEEHKFKYKGIISEQMALKRICEVSEGDEEKASRIIDQSISRGWMDFYKLKQSSKNGSDGQSKQSNPKDGSQQPASNSEKFKRGFIRRNGNGEQDGSSEHLKAV